MFLVKFSLVSKRETPGVSNLTNEWAIIGNPQELKGSVQFIESMLNPPVKPLFNDWIVYEEENRQYLEMVEVFYISNQEAQPLLEKAKTLSYLVSDLDQAIDNLQYNACPRLGSLIFGVKRGDHSKLEGYLYAANKHV